MQDASPYGAPIHESPPPVLVHRPAVLRTFGWLHEIGAVAGALMTVGTFALSSGYSDLLRLRVGGDPLLQQAQSFLKGAQTILRVVGISGCITSIPMFVAGVKLLRQRDDALLWANGYAVLSLVMKAILLVVIVSVVMANTTGAVFLPGVKALLLAVYPAAALILLNRPKVRAWFAAKKAQAPDPPHPSQGLP